MNATQSHPLESLLAQHCPNDVEFRPLYELTFWDKKFKAVEKSWQPKTIKFKHILAKDLQNLAVPNGDIKLLSTGKFDDFTDTQTALNFINEGEIIAIPSGGEANLKYFKGKFVDSGNILATARDCTTCLKFVYYYLLTRQKDLDSSFRGGSIKHPDMKKVLQIQIPLPPLAVQEKIVEILDKFTQLQARKKQYEYYRNKLLSFEELQRRTDRINGGGLKLVSLGELLQYEQPTKYIVQNTQYNDEFSTPVLTAGASFILGYTDEINGVYQASKEKPCVIFDDFTTSFHWVDFPFKVKSSAMKILTPVIASEQGERGNPKSKSKKLDCHDFASAESRNDDYIQFRFIYYAMKCIYYFTSEHARQWISKYSQIQIPLPPLEVQRDIVEILDKFDALTNDLARGLPAEIEARKKQYEYYRERLLDFR
ncbi:restriction endonuclease subunit S [Campylobacter helveticus]|uniref:restriction endonuclease subunit S n=1 Tax=Campylobacter helveticus TaxID=28898 RepID=UPI00214A1FE3|nr:restriction endonuclease subunit S [Campylobacter helveticus]MCR2063572.1 restriction endonuclease subunit S [Campylobacter helveticus]